MTVYKYFLKLGFKHRNIIIAYTVVFFILGILNSTGTEETISSFSESELDIGIVDESRSELSSSLIEYLEQDNNIEKLVNHRGNIEELIFLEALDAAIIIPRDFENLFLKKEKSIEIIRDERKAESSGVLNEVNKFLAFISASYDGTKYDFKKVENILKEEVEVEFLDAEINVGSSKLDRWFSGYFNFTGYVIMAIYISVIGLVMREFNDTNIQERMKVSSKKFLSFNIQMYLGQISISILITSVFVLGSILLKGKYISEINFSKYLLNISVFSFSILGLTFLVNNLTRNTFLINAASTVLSLGTSFISGVLVPQEVLGENVLKIAKFFPTYYFVKINEMKIDSFMDIRYELLMQVLFGVSFLLIGLYFSKVKQRS